MENQLKFQCACTTAERLCRETPDFNHSA